MKLWQKQLWQKLKLWQGHNDEVEIMTKHQKWQVKIKTEVNYDMKSLNYGKGLNNISKLCHDYDMKTMTKT